MKYLLLLLIIPFFTAGKCGNPKNKTGKENTEQATDSIPVCVQKLIDDGNKETPSNAPIQIDEYLYKGKKVFLFTAQCCDQFNMLYDDSCKTICAPSGGFTGRGDLRCIDFDSLSKHIKVIWRNPNK
jgi:hypothetical protein